MSKAARGSCNPQSKAKGHGVVELWLATSAANGRKDASAPNCPGLFWPGSHPRTTLDTVPSVKPRVLVQGQLSGFCTAAARSAALLLAGVGVPVPFGGTTC